MCVLLTQSETLFGMFRNSVILWTKKKLVARENCHFSNNYAATVWLLFESRASLFFFGRIFQFYGQNGSQWTESEIEPARYTDCISVQCSMYANVVHNESENNSRICNSITHLFIIIALLPACIACVSFVLVFFRQSKIKMNFFCSREKWQLDNFLLVLCELFRIGKPHFSCDQHESNCLVCSMQGLK